MEESVKTLVGVVLGVIGTGLVLFGAITPDELIDYAQIVIGITLVGGYCVISWDWFKSFFGRDPSTALLMPPLVTFGVLAIYVSLTSPWLVPPHDKIMLGLGGALVVVPLVLLFKALKA